MHDELTKIRTFFEHNNFIQLTSYVVENDRRHYDLLHATRDINE